MSRGGQRLAEEVVADLLRYDPETGDLIWRPRPASMFEGKRRPAPVLAAIWNTRYAGKIAGSRDREGYLDVKLFDRHYLAHRLAWVIYHGKWPDEQIDHISGDRHDNRITNLRCATALQNSRNRKRPSNNTSGHTGVSWNKKCGAWGAHITHKRRAINLGLFQDIDDALSARKKAESDLGFHSNHGRAQ